jgi:hypothetical protein
MKTMKFYLLQYLLSEHRYTKFGIGTDLRFELYYDAVSILDSSALDVRLVTEYVTVTCLGGNGHSLINTLSWHLPR